MARHETLDVVQATSSLLDNYRAFYSDQDAMEVPRMSLVAHHDPTIYFTNSTTSVMKPFIAGESPFDRSLYLTQPAMGSQGINAWQSERALGPYASYFVSLGSLYRPNLGEQAVSDILTVADTSWGFGPDNLSFQVDERDNDILALLESCGARAEVQQQDDGLFRHRYGMDGVTGRNANLHLENGSGPIQLGNLTLIETPAAASQESVWEVSFDSSPVLAAMYGLRHAIQALPASEMITVGDGENKESLVAADCATISSSLMLEGLRPQSRGKSGILRKFFREYCELMVEAGHDAGHLTDALVDTAEREIQIREHLSPEPVPTADLAQAKDIMAEWVQRITSQKT